MAHRLLRVAAVAASASMAVNAQTASVSIDASKVDHTVNPLIFGCHSDLGYAHAGRGFYSQMIYGEIFERTPLKVSAWTPVTGPTGTVGMDSNLTFNGNPTLKIVYTSGSGPLGYSNRGMGNQGMSWVGGNGYSGYIYASAPGGTSITIAAVDTVTGSVQDTSTVITAPGGGFHRFDFTLGPGSNTTCVSIPAGSDPTVDCGNLPNGDFSCQKCSGSIQVILNGPGEANIGYIFVGPGSWGTYQGLPVRRDTVTRMQQMGITAIRQGGTYGQTIYWKEWRGPSAFRPSNGHTWGNSLISGWGPFDLVDLAQAMGITPILTLAEDQPGSDWADLIDYIWGNESTVWGAQRSADGHPDPYDLRIVELGNEQYNVNFVEQVASMEARAAAMGRAGQMTYMFPTNQGLNAADLAKAASMGLPLNMIAADIHVEQGGGVQQAINDFAANPAYNTSAINCETNADYPPHPGGMHGMVRALLEAADLNSWLNAPAAVAGRLVARTASFCNSASSNFDGFDQAISFFDQGATWIQPPGYVHAMIAATPADQALIATVSGSTAGLSVSSQRTAAADHLYVRVVNSNTAPASVALTISNWTPSTGVTVWTLLSATANGGNSAATPTAVVPTQSNITWSNGGTVSVPASSYVILGFVPA